MKGGDDDLDFKRSLWKAFGAWPLAFCTGNPPSAAAHPLALWGLFWSPSMSNETVAPGKVVLFHYTLTNDTGEILDQSEENEPMPYLHGADNIVSGLEKQMEGHQVGDKFRATVAPEDGYGVFDPKKIQMVSRRQFPAKMQLHPGMDFMMQAEDGSHAQFWIKELKGQHVVIDLNHPLAGVTLHFSVEIAGIREASKEEIDHGHPHGPDGHGHHHH